jgi:hypothetical protein
MGSNGRALDAVSPDASIQVVTAIARMTAGTDARVRIVISRTGAIGKH